jgi:hypothetical protein
MSNQKSPYSFGGNGVSSLAQSISKIGEAFGGLRKEKQRLNDKMLDSEIRIREGAVRDTLKSSLKESEIKTAGKQERKTYKKQVNTNVKAAERLTGTKKGEGVTEGGTKFRMTPTSLDLTTKKTSAPATPAKTSRPASKPAAKTPAAKPAATPKATPKAPAAKPAATPKPTAKKVK